MKLAKKKTFQLTLCPQVESSLPIEKVREAIGTYSDNPDNIIVLDSEVDEIEIVGD